MKGILGRKVGMSQVFSQEGKMIPVTVIEVQPNFVCQVKTLEKDGYQALQLAVEEKRVNLTNRPDLGQFKKHNTTPKRFIKEIRDMTNYEAGQTITLDIFNPGEFVDVTGVSKGKGFSGVIKRYNFSRGPMAHGSGYHRGIGSMGAIAPNRIFKRKKMPGRHGFDQVTIQNLEVIAILKDKHALLVKGAVPGPKKQFLVIKKSIKRQTIQKQPVKLMFQQVEQPQINQ